MVLRIGQIQYANCIPIFTALKRNHDCKHYRFVTGAPTRLNHMLSIGAIDLCPCSSIEYGRSPGSYFLFPELSISSFGPVRSVILFSTLPLQELDGEQIALTTESASSVALLKIILRLYLGFSNRFVGVRVTDPETVFHSCRAVLVIGDTALKWSGRKTGFYHRYDLGELWYALTGLPFVFALWMIRAETVAAQPLESARICDRLLAAKRYALSNLDRMADELAESDWMERNELLSYWKTISYDLTESHLKGVNLFFRSAARLGILAEEPALRFFRASEGR